MATTFTVWFKQSADSNFTQYDGMVSAPTEMIAGLLPGTSYDFYVVATNEVGSSSHSATYTVATQPALPGLATGLFLSGVTTTEVTLSWTAPTTGTGPIDMQASYGPHGSNVWTATGPLGPQTSVVIDGLDPGTQYDFKVTSSNTAGSADSVIVTGSTAQSSVPPGTPDTPVASNITSTGVTLTTAGSSTGTTPINYQWQSRLSGIGSYANYGSASQALTIAVTGLSAATAYDFLVIAQNGVSPDAPSLPLTGVTTAAAIPSAPTNPVVTDITTTTISVDCTPSVTGTPAPTYQWQYRVHGTVLWTDGPAAALTTAATITGLTPATFYDFQVIAANIAGSATSASFATAETTVVVPSTPSGLAVTAGTTTPNGATFTWLASSPSSPQVSYQLQVAPHGSSSFTNAGPLTTALTQVVVGLLATTAYDFQIIASNIGGSSSPSAVVPVTTASAAVQGTVVTTSGTTIFVSQTPGSPMPAAGPFNAWALTGPLGRAILNGTTVTTVTAIITLLVWNNTLYAESQNANTLGAVPGWWSWNGGSFIAVTNDPRLTESPDPTTITAAGQTIYASTVPGQPSTGSLDLWTLPTGTGGAIARDGVNIANTGAAVMAYYTGHTLYFDGSFLQTFPTATPGSGSITDNQGNIFAIDVNKNMLENGAPIPGGTNTAKIEFYNNQTYGQDATTLIWYIWNGATFNQAAAPPATGIGNGWGYWNGTSFIATADPHPGVPQLSLTTIGAQTAGVPFGVSFGILNYPAAPTVNTWDNNGTHGPLPAGSTVTKTQGSFTHPALAAGNYTVGIEDRNNTSVFSISPSFQVSTSGTGPAASSNFVTVDFANLTSPGGVANCVVYPQLFGVSTGGIANNGFGVCNNTAFQSLVQALNPPLFRLNSISWDASNPANLRALAVNAANLMSPSCTFILGIAGSQGQAQAVATFWQTNAPTRPCRLYEAFNESGGSFNNYQNTMFAPVAAGVRAVNSANKTFGPIWAGWPGTGFMQQLINANTASVLAGLDWHEYGYCQGDPQAPSNTQMCLGQDSSSGNRIVEDIPQALNATGGTYLSGAPLFIGEYNTECSAGSDLRAGTSIGPCFAISVLFGAVSVSTQPVWGGIWDLYDDAGANYNLIDTGFNVYPQYYLLKLLTQKAPGPMVNTATGSTGAGISPFATKNGAAFCVPIVNSTSGAKSGPVALSHWPVNSTGNGTATLYTYPATSTSQPVRNTPYNVSTITVTAGLTQSITIPAFSHVVITS